MKSVLPSLLLLWIMLPGHARIKDQDFTVLFYNVENLFDINDDPATMDDDFLPGSARAWDQEKYERKLAHIAEVIGALNPDVLPEMVGLCEVENRLVLEDLVSLRSLRKGEYDFVHHEGPDARGIDCALLYNREVFSVEESRSVPVIFPFDSTEKTRDMLYVKFRSQAQERLHVFVNHWPSRAEGQRESEPKRLYAAVALRKEIDLLFGREPEARIIVMGDFNDEPTNRSIFEMLHANNKRRNRGPRELYNLMYDMHNLEGQGTYYYRGNWNMLDQFLVSDPLLKGNGTWKVIPEAAGILKEDFLLYFDEAKEQSLPDRTYGGTRYYGGYSDHLPIYMKVLSQ